MGFELHRPLSVDEAIGLAGRVGAEARYLAGGTDLLIQINRQRSAPTNLIALDRVAGLSGIAAGAEISLGALTTMKAIERDPRFAGPLAALREAACVVGGHQIRNVATIGGNIANASPAADLLPVLLALNAEVELAGGRGVRRMPLRRFLRGPGLAERDADELLLRVAFAPPSADMATAFLKAGRRRAMEISLVCVAALLVLGKDGSCREARIALGAVGPTALRATAAEQALRDHQPTEASFRMAGALAAGCCAPISDVRASAEYRRRLVEVLVSRALQRCLQQIEARRR